MTIQELIGPHPQPSHIYGEWWSFVDLASSDTKKHRALDEIDGVRERAIDKLAQWLVEYHLTHINRLYIEQMREILERNDLVKHIDQLNILPLSDKTRKGNLGEIMLIEYLKESRGFTSIIPKLHYNPNINQSMKGDDVLMFNPNNWEEEVIYGECKYRGEPSKATIGEIINNLDGSLRFPVSITFVANCLDREGETELALRITQIHIKIINGEIPLTNVGFLISSHTTKNQVEKHLSSTNPRLVMISLGVDNPQQIVDEAYSKADAILKTI